MYILLNVILSIILVPLFTLGWKDKQKRWVAFFLSLMGFTPFFGVPFIWFLYKTTVGNNLCPFVI